VKLLYNKHYTQFGKLHDRTIEAVFEDDSCTYIVERHTIPDKTPFEFRLLIKRADGQPIRAWRLLQDIKNEVAGKDRVAIEVYPAESEVTDTANVYHLWVFPEGYGPIVSVIPP